MARGVPTLVSNVGANKDMVGDCGGIIVKAKNANSAVNGFKEASQLTAEDYDAISMTEISKVKAYYLTNVVLDKLLDLYKEMEDEK